MTDYAAQRRDVRFAIAANALAVDLETGARREGSVDNISRGGCFVRIAEPFLVWARLRLWLVYRGQQFEAQGSVTHARVGFGMGFVFDSITPENQEVLESWLRELGT